MQFLEQSEYSLLWEKDLRYLHQPDIAADYEAFDELMNLTRFTLAGNHTRHNAFLVERALAKIMPETDVLPAINSFPGTNRRFEKLTERLYSDYGHTPTEITATLQMAGELSEEVILVYQPHQNVRPHEIRRQYTDGVFAGAKKAYWLPTYLSRENPDLPILSPEELTENLHKTEVHTTEMNDDLWDTIQRHIDAGHLVLCMGAGSIDGWVREQTRNN